MNFPASMAHGLSTLCPHKKHCRELEKNALLENVCSDECPFVFWVVQVLNGGFVMILDVLCYFLGLNFGK